MLFKIKIIYIIYYDNDANPTIIFKIKQKCIPQYINECRNNIGKNNFLRVFNAWFQTSSHNSLRNQLKMILLFRGNFKMSILNSYCVDPVIYVR